MLSNNAIILLEANCVLYFGCIELYNDKARRSNILLLWLVGGYSNYWLWFSCMWYFHESMLTKTSDGQCHHWNETWKDVEDNDIIRGSHSTAQQRSYGFKLTNLKDFGELALE